MSERDRSYRIEARSKDKDQFLIITDSRTRALKFSALLMGNEGEYTQVSVQVGDRVWVGSRIGEIP